MSKLFVFPVLAILTFQSCETKVSNNISEKEKLVEYKDDSIRCPKGKHTDLIIPIIYGLPTKETFAEADSGLVSLGGCEIEDDSPSYYCKKHGVSF